MKRFVHVLMAAVGPSIGALWALANPVPALAFDVSTPVVQGNLAVYPIREGRQNPSAITTIDDALRRKQVTVDDRSGDVHITNRSGLPILVPFGTLLRGGSQDQIVAESHIIPPHAEDVAIDTYCVDPFRTSTRFGEVPHVFGATGLISPSRAAKLSLLVGQEHSGPVTRTRQAGVWWSIDTLRQQLSRRTGAPLTPQTPAHWLPSDDPLPGRLMQSRSTVWTDSLPLALDDARLERMTNAITAPISTNPRAARGGDIVGAAFAINGRFVGAERYQSHALFEKMWPALLRSYAIESIAERGTAVPRPAPRGIEALLRSAAQDTGLDAQDGAMTIHDGPSTVVSRTADDDGHVAVISYVQKLDPTLANRTPDAAIVQMLASGDVAGYDIDRLKTAPVLAFSPATREWSVRADQLDLKSSEAVVAGSGPAAGHASSGGDYPLVALLVDGLFLVFWAYLLRPLVPARVRGAIGRLARFATSPLTRTASAAGSIASRSSRRISARVRGLMIVSPAWLIRRAFGWRGAGRPGRRFAQ